MESGPRKRVGEVRQNSGGGGRGGGRVLGRGREWAKHELVEGSPSPGWGKVAGRTEASLVLERAGVWSFGRWDKDLLLVGRGRGGGCCLLFKNFLALGVRYLGQGREGVTFLSASLVNQSLEV